MIEEAFEATMVGSPEEVKNFPLPKGEDLLAGLEKGITLLKIYSDTKLVGGAMIDIKEPHVGSLELFFIAGNIEGKGIGLQAWKAIEKMYSDVRIWETMTPYFQKRNIYFYVNKCGFHIVEYHNKWNPIMEDGVPVEDEMFVFRKEIL